MPGLRSGGPVVALLAVLAVLAACGGGAASPGATSTGGASNPPAASLPAEPTDEPTDGGGPEISVPPIVDAQYTKGTFHAEISGGVTATLDVPLQGGFSFTSGGSTVLGYADPTSGDGGGIVIGPDVVGVTLSTKQVSTAGSNADANHCNMTITRSDATGLAGTFDCTNLLGVNPSNSQNITVNLRGTFEASR